MKSKGKNTQGKKRSGTLSARPRSQARAPVPWVWRMTKAAGWMVVGAIGVLTGLWVWHLENRPDLKVWHTAALDAEFTAGKADSFTDYLALEERLFAQLKDRVLGGVQPGDLGRIDRYNPGSLADPDRWSPNWNRTFELSADEPRAGVLLLHGMSDSPYSLHSLGLTLNAAGAWVVGLRLPGHGTSPSGMSSLKWQDMAEAVRLAADHLRGRVGDRPLILVGYSNGGALAVHHALSALEDDGLARADRIVLLSPAIGVTPLAVFAVWQARLGALLGLPKLAWTDILPEYDPFKYNSFTVNAGDQVYRLTAAIQSQLDRLGPTGALKRFPPVLAFQSAADATVSTRVVVDGLFRRLPAGGHELVLFDINRRGELTPVLEPRMLEPMERHFAGEPPPFAVTIVTNQNGGSRLVLRKMPEGGEAFVDEPADLTWPDGLVSLTHVALPFSPADPLYGMDTTQPSPGIRLGRLALYGERGVLQLPGDSLLRLRSNPFYGYLEQRVLGFTGLSAE